MNSATNQYCVNCGYSLRELPVQTCPECGGQFCFDDRQTWALHPTFCNRGLPVAGSFAGSILGWLFGICCYATYTISIEPINKSLSMASSYNIAAFSAALGWMLFALFVVFLENRLHVLRSPWLAIVAGVFFSTTGLWMFVLALGEKPWSAYYRPLSIWAIIVGIGSAFGARFTLRPHWVRAAAGPPRRVLVFFWLLGPTALATWMFGVWPVVCRISPDLAYRLGRQDRKEWAIRFVLQQVKVGDPAIRLEQLLPSVFSHRALPASLRSADSSPELASGSWGFNCGHDYFRVVVENGYIVELRN